jgi:hypothetical protein
MSGALLERIEALWASPSLGMWAMVAAAVIVALVLFVIVLKADRSLANGALAVITLLALGVASAALMRDKPASATGAAPSVAVAAGQSALACLDGLAGERVESVCEKALFATADSTAAAVSYTAAQISRLPAVAAQAGPELGQLRRVLERDRYGLVAQVLAVREGCTPEACDAFRYLVNTSQISANMTGRAFETVVGRYADAWGDAPQMASAAPSSTPMAPVAAPSVAKPSSIDFPSSASIPQVDIMAPSEPQRGVPAPPPIVTVTQPPAPPPPAPVAAAPAAPLPGSVAYPPAVLPHQSLPLQQPAPSQLSAAPPPAPKSASNAPAQPKRAPAPKRQPAAAASPPPVQLVPPQPAETEE